MLKRRKKRKFILVIAMLGIFLFIFFLLYILTSVIFNGSDFLSPIPISNSAKNQIQALLGSHPSKELESLLLKNKISFISINAGSEYSYLVKLNDGEEIYFSSKKPLGPQVDSLQYVLSRLTIEGKRFAKLDLRFDKPVITLK